MPAFKHHKIPPDTAPLIALAEANDAELAELEAEASSGCSVCARALVNAREGAVDLAVSSIAAPHTPSSGLRARVLADGSARIAAAGPRTLPSAALSVDPSGAVARIHVGGPEEADRRDEITALGALERDLDCERILGQVKRLLGFPVFFVAVLRGEHVANRVRHGAPPDLDELLREVPRQTTFCTHCVDAGVPLVVENARAEPFFRGGAMVLQFGVGSYVGVPLKTSRGLTVGTLCALDVSARKVSETDVRILEAFAVPVVAKLEHARTPELEAALLEHARPGAEVYRAAWFGDVLALVRARSATHPAALLTVEGADPARVGAATQPSEVAGRLAVGIGGGAPHPGSLGILLASSIPTEAEARAAALRAALPGAKVVVSRL